MNRNERREALIREMWGYQHKSEKGTLTHEPPAAPTTPKAPALPLPTKARETQEPVLASANANTEEQKQT